MQLEVATALGLAALPSLAAASGIALSTCEDRGLQVRAMLMDRQNDRYAMFVEQDLAEESGFDIETSRHVIADCRAGWQIAVAASDDRATGLMHEMYYGDTVYDRAGLRARLKADGVAFTSGSFDRDHCACKVDPSGDTHLVDD